MCVCVCVCVRASTFSFPFLVEGRVLWAYSALLTRHLILLEIMIHFWNGEARKLRREPEKYPQGLIKSSRSFLPPVVI